MGEKPEDFDPGTGQHNGITQRGNQTGGNNKKIRNVTLMVGKQEKIAFEKYWNCKIMHIFQQFDILKKVISIHKLCPQSLLKHSVVHVQGIAMKI